MTERKAKLLIDGKTIELDIYSGTLGPDVIDVNTLIKHGYFTYDLGFNSTASCESKITYIDGDEGKLLYRGYPIEELARHSNFLEVCYLLLNGELPTKPQFVEFSNVITHHTMVHFTGCRKHHVQKVFRIREMVLRRHKRLANRIFVTHGSNRRHFGNQAMR